jgi:hypothetical protein
MVPAEFAILDQNSSAYHPMLMINILFGFYFVFFFCSAKVTRVSIYLPPINECELVVEILNSSV